MNKIQWKGGAMLGPLPPVMVTCGTMEESNIITIGWTGIVNTIPPKTYISIRPTRHSYNIIKESGEFAINLTTAAIVAAADTCGVYTGRKVDKFARCKLTKEPSAILACPLIGESPLSLACRVTDIIPMGSHDMFLADIVGVEVDPAYIDENGKLHLERAGLAAYLHGEYYALGQNLGTFGFSVKKKGKHPTKKPGAPKKKTAAENPKRANTKK
ncbi:MAG: flavin reductase family protein [Clostridia bacterium]|nr:flavin reductase family protein [Clostridia bacterium]